MRKLLPFSFVILMIIGLNVLAVTMPLTEEVIEKLKADGTLEDVVAQYDNAKSRGLDKPNVNPFRFNPDIQ
ncbi:MAG: hypothetical protein GY855_07955, partial [candidate division Zixibacteria bacterium]|nr:hypothetical protein [candidate division Zixibacteria bacterium]